MKRIKQAVLALLFCIWAISAHAVNVNKASAAELAEALKGVGPAKAEAIIKYRDENGPIKSLQQLTEVKGLGPAILEKNKEVIEF